MHGHSNGGGIPRYPAAPAPMGGAPAQGIPPWAPAAPAVPFSSAPAPGPAAPAGAPFAGQAGSPIPPAPGALATGVQAQVGGAPPGLGAWPQPATGGGSALGGIVRAFGVARLVWIGIFVVLALVGGGFALYAYSQARQLEDPTSELSREMVASRVQETLEEGLAELPRASEVCGCQLAAVSSVAVTDIQTVGTNYDGTGTARVSLVGTPAPGQQLPAPGPCTGVYHYQYAFTTEYQGETIVYVTNLNEVQFFRPLGVGATVTGTIQPGDHASGDGALADAYGLELTAGQPVTIVVRGGPEATAPGQSLDMMAVLFSMDGQILAQDDDSAGSLNARLVFTPTQSGLHVLRVTHAIVGTHHGAYTVQTLPGANPMAT